MFVTSNMFCPSLKRRAGVATKRNSFCLDNSFAGGAAYVNGNLCVFDRNLRFRALQIGDGGTSCTLELSCFGTNGFTANIVQHLQINGLV